MVATVEGANAVINFGILTLAGKSVNVAGGREGIASTDCLLT